MPGHSAGCWQRELTLCAKEKLNEGLCLSLTQCLLSCYGHKGESLKSPRLCSPAARTCRAITEPTSSWFKPQHKPAAVLSRKSPGCHCTQAAVQQSVPHSRWRAATTSHMEYMQQTFLHTLCHSTSRSQASLVQHQQHDLQQTSLHANPAEFVQGRSHSALDGSPHISETILRVFQAIPPNQTLAEGPGNNLSE